jgi:hypothetical protein
MVPEVNLMTTAQRAYQMLGNESLWSITERCDSVLSAAAIPYSICGGVAVCLHGYPPFVNSSKTPNQAIMIGWQSQRELTSDLPTVRHQIHI